MEQSSKAKTLLAVLAIAVLALVIYFVSNTDKAVPPSDNVSEEIVPVVTKTQAVDGVLPPPPGFPTELMVEAEVLDSQTVVFAERNTKQLIVSFYSSKTVDQKYNDYRKYMSEAGYALTEGESDQPVKTIFGNNGKSYLSVEIRVSSGKTLVDLSYYSGI